MTTLMSRITGDTPVFAKFGAAVRPILDRVARFADLMEIADDPAFMALRRSE